MDEIATQIKTYANNVRIYSQFSPKVYSFLTNSEKNKSINKNYPPRLGFSQNPPTFVARIKRDKLIKV